MDLISAKAYENVKVYTIKVKKDLWVSMKDIGNGLGVKNISDLVLKEIQGHYEKKKQKKKLNALKWLKEKYLKNLVN